MRASKSLTTRTVKSYLFIRGSVTLDVGSKQFSHALQDVGVVEAGRSVLSTTHGNSSSRVAGSVPTFKHGHEGHKDTFRERHGKLDLQYSMIVPRDHQPWARRTDGPDY